MKKIVRFIITVTAVLTVLSVIALPAKAEEVLPKDFDYGVLADKLPDSIKERFSLTFDANSLTKDAERLTSWDLLLSAFGETMSSALTDMFPKLCRLTGLVLIAAALNAVASSFESKSARILRTVSVCVLSCAVVLTEADTAAAVTKYLADLTSLVTVMSPLTAVLYASGGNTATAGVSTTAFSVFIGVAENIVAKTVTPFFGICLCLACIDATFPKIGLNGLLGLIKKTYTSILTFVMAIFCAVLSAQTAISTATDSVALRAARFAAGSAIPIVGGSVGETLKTLTAGIGVLKSSFGIIGVVLIGFLTLPMLITLLLDITVFNAVGAVSDLLGCEAEKKLFTSVSGIFGCLAAVVTVCSLMFVFLLVLLVRLV